MARFEHRGQGRFVEVTLDGTAVRIVTGALGAKGAPVDRSFPDAATAAREVETLAGQLLGRGYIQIVHGGAAGDDADGGEATGAQASSAQLEAAIDADRARPEPYLVYADWLQARGDPRGELIVVQHAIAEAGAKVPPALRKREAEILVRHQDVLLGDLVYEREDSILEWRFGFLRAATLHPSTEVQSLSTIVGDLLAHPSSRFLEELTLGLPHAGRRDFRYGDVAEVMARHRDRLDGLRAFAVGAVTDPSESGYVDRLDDLEMLWPLVPRVRRLAVRFWPQGPVSPIELPELEELRLEVPSPVLEWRSTIAALRAPSLRSLAVDYVADRGFGEEEDDAQSVGVAAALQPIDPAGFPALRSLAIRRFPLGNALVDALASHPILGRLERLDLSQGTLSTVGVRHLAAAQAFRSLRSLDVSRCGLPPADVAVLRAALRNAVLEPQTPPASRYDEADE